MYFEIFARLMSEFDMAKNYKYLIGIISALGKAQKVIDTDWYNETIDKLQHYVKEDQGYFIQKLIVALRPNFSKRETFHSLLKTYREKFASQVAIDNPLTINMIKSKEEKFSRNYRPSMQVGDLNILEYFEDN